MNKATLLFSLRYVAALFAVGFVLGAARVGLLVPSVGERAAELMEAPLMLVAIAFIARSLVRRALQAGAAVHFARAGLLALALMLITELTVVLGLRGLSLAGYVASRDAIAGGVYLLLLGVFAVMPMVANGVLTARRPR